MATATTEAAPVKFVSIEMPTFKPFFVAVANGGVSIFKAIAKFAMAVAIMCPALVLSVVAFVAAYSVPLENVSAALGADIAFVFPYLCAIAAFVAVTWIARVVDRMGSIIVLPGAEEDPNAEVIEMSAASEEATESKFHWSFYLLGALVAARLLMYAVQGIWANYPGLLDF